MKQSIFSSLLIVGGTTLLLNILSLAFLSPIIKMLQTPPSRYASFGNEYSSRYLFLIFLGMIPMAVYNFYAFLLRSVGNSSSPLYFLLISVALNIVLDVLFMVGLKMGVKGAAMATVISQIVSAAGIYLYTWKQFPELRLSRDDRQIDFSSIRKIASFSYLTCMQQSVMNLGILMVQGLINSFGTTVMAAFAAAVKIDSFAYMPVQDFGNAFSTFIAQNFGARRQDRIRRGIRCAWLTTTLFAGIVSILVFFFATELMRIFIPASEQEIISICLGNTAN